MPASFFDKSYWEMLISDALRDSGSFQFFLKISDPEPSRVLCLPSEKSNLEITKVKTFWFFWKEIRIPFIKKKP